VKTGTIQVNHHEAFRILILWRTKFMNSTAVQSPYLKSHWQPRHTAVDHFRKHWQLWVWILIVSVVNWPLWHGQVRSNLIFLPEAVLDGQWWRIITYPFVHLSWYHLLLDAGGFLLLWSGLEQKRLPVKLLYGIGAGAGSLLFALVAEPSITFRGLSGLSGVAHGLMAVSALEMLRHPGQRSWGWWALILVSGKSAYEFWTGRVILEFMHMGLCGRPLAACHGGGVIGALLVFALIRVKRAGANHETEMGDGCGAINPQTP
jgi:rhomboid family GlyGly-CTERM serine protease